MVKSRLTLTLNEGTIFLKASELAKILHVLNSHSPQGVGVFCLARETSLEPHVLRQYLSKHTDYFVQLPNEQSYQINRFGECKGSIEAMVKNHEKALTSQKPGHYGLLYFLFIAAFISLSTIFL